MINQRIVRAAYDINTIIVYQAFKNEIADSALKAQTFVAPFFKRDRMTWIKPSFLWMMYRSGWGTKENQERILEIKILRSGFDWAIKNSCLTHFDQQSNEVFDSWNKRLKNSSVLIQWDPERDIYLNPLPYRSIQVGLRSEALETYIKNWIVSINDISLKCQELKGLIDKKPKSEINNLLPIENVYPLDNLGSRNKLI